MGHDVDGPAKEHGLGFLAEEALELGTVPGPKDVAADLDDAGQPTDLRLPDRPFW
jgi:hypothetical protein